MPTFESQRPDQFGWPTPPAGDFVPFSFQGHSFPSGVARGTETIFRVALERICRAPGFALPASTGLDAGMWGQDTRRKRGGTAWSFHAYGLALDVAAPWNPYGSSRPPTSAHRLPDSTQELVRDLGLLWGAQFDDWMHLECHLSPSEAGDLTRQLDGRNSPTPTADDRQAFPLPSGHYYGPRSGPDQSVSNTWNPRADWVAGLASAQLKLGVNADGLYGPVTAAALRGFQMMHGLSADGLLGPNTWRAMFG